MPVSSNTKPKMVLGNESSSGYESSSGDEVQSSSLNEEEIPGGPDADVHKFLKYGKEKLPHQKTLEV